MDLLKRLQEAGETVRQALDRLSKELLTILKDKKIGFLGLGMEGDNFVWQAIADSKADDIVAGKWYYGNYSMHYGGSVSSGYDTEEDVVKAIRDEFVEEIFDGDAKRLDVPVTEDLEMDEHASEVKPDDAIDQPNWEHDAETIFPTIIKGWKPESED